MSPNLTSVGGDPCREHVYSVPVARSVKLSLWHYTNKYPRDCSCITGITFSTQSSASRPRHISTSRIDSRFNILNLYRPDDGRDGSDVGIRRPARSPPLPPKSAAKQQLHFWVGTQHCCAIVVEMHRVLDPVHYPQSLFQPFLIERAYVPAVLIGTFVAPFLLGGMLRASMIVQLVHSMRACNA